MHEQNDRLNVILLDYRLKTLTVNCWLQILLHIEPKPGALILTLPYIDAFMDIKKIQRTYFLARMFISQLPETPCKKSRLKTGLSGFISYSHSLQSHT